MELDNESIRLGVQVGQFVLTSAVGFYVYLTNRDRVTNERISKLETDLDTRMDAHAQRITAVEEAAKHAPTHEDLGRIYDQITATRRDISDTKAAVAGVQSGMSALERNTALITEYLVKGGKQ